jgi:hypothetical protein
MARRLGDAMTGEDGFPTTSKPRTIIGSGRGAVGIAAMGHPRRPIDGGDRTGREDAK